MEFIIIILIVLATSKVTLQGIYSRKYITDFSDSICFNGIIYFFASLVFSFALKCSPQVIPFAFVFGVLTVLFQLFYIQAMSCGNLSLTVLIVNSGMIIPIIVSAVFFKEQFGVFRIAGIITILFSISLSVNKKTVKSKLKWFLLSVTCFLTNGCLSVCQQLFGKTALRNEGISFVAWSYLFATVISFVLYIIILKCKCKKVAVGIKPGAWIYGLCVGVILGTFQILNTKAIAALDAGLLFPIYNSGTLILTTISGVFLFKDKLTRKLILKYVRSHLRENLAMTSPL